MGAIVLWLVGFTGTGTQKIMEITHFSLNARKCRFKQGLFWGYLSNKLTKRSFFRLVPGTCRCFLPFSGRPCFVYLFHAKRAQPLVISMPAYPFAIRACPLWGVHGITLEYTPNAAVLFFSSCSGTDIVPKHTAA